MANELKDLKTPLAAAVASSSVWRDTELVASHQSGKASGQSQWNETEYCLYRYTPNCSSGYAFTSDGGSADHTSGGHFQGSGFSLSLIGSSVAADKEHFLREQIATKLSRGSLYQGSGQVTTLDPIAFPPPSQIYYCLLEIPKKKRQASSSSGSESDMPTSPLRTDSNRQYVVCFALLGKAGLDLFRTELDGFSVQLQPLLPDKPAPEAMVSFAGSTLQSQMSKWFSQRVQYITRVVQLCQKVFPQLLHTAINSQVEVSGPNQCNVEDVKLFLDTCSMANLMQFDGETKVATSSPPAQNEVSVTVSHDSCTLSSNETSQFCSNWAQVLLAQGTSAPDPFFLRQAVENYKLKIVQDLNAFKRLLREAESDYHALYRSYLFLSVCGNGKQLLQCVCQEASAVQATPTLAVLEALQTFSQKNGFRTVSSGTK